MIYPSFLRSRWAPTLARFTVDHEHNVACPDVVGCFSYIHPMIREESGNLLDADTDALVNAVNTVGVMGKGIALQSSRPTRTCSGSTHARHGGAISMSAECSCGKPVLPAGRDGSSTSQRSDTDARPAASMMWPLACLPS